MKNKKILAGICLGAMLATMPLLTACSEQEEQIEINSSYTLTVINDSVNGVITPKLDNETNSVTVDKGDNYTFTITPKSGYEIKNLLIDGELVEPKNIYTFIDINSDHSIGAVYSPIDTSAVNMLSIRLGLNHDYNHLKEDQFEFDESSRSFSIYRFPENTKLEVTGKIIQLLPNEDFEYNYLYADKKVEIADFSVASDDLFMRDDWSDHYGYTKYLNIILNDAKNSVHFYGSEQKARFEITLNIKFKTSANNDDNDIYSGTYKDTNFNIVASLDNNNEDHVTFIREDGYSGNIFAKNIDLGEKFLSNIELVFAK